MSDLALIEHLVRRRLQRTKASGSHPEIWTQVLMGQAEGTPATLSPRLVNTATPIMLAMTMQVTAYRAMPLVFEFIDPESEQKAEWKVKLAADLVLSPQLLLLR